jgi:hypothetical protein
MMFEPLQVEFQHARTIYSLCGHETIAKLPKQNLVQISNRVVQIAFHGQIMPLTKLKRPKKVTKIRS